MFAGQGKELANVPRAGLAKGLQESFDHGPEQFVGLQVQRWACQTRVASVEQCCAEKVQPSDSPVQESPHDRLGG
jgi:hypothetical protein